MSILADLLSKSNPAEPQSGKDIPPTLARAQGAAAQKRTPKRRFIVVVVAAAAIVAVGLVASTMLGRLATRTTVKYPLPPPPAAAPTQQASAAPPPQQPQQQQASVGPAPSQPAEQPVKPRVAFETKPSRPETEKPAAAAVTGRHGHPRPRQAAQPASRKQAIAGSSQKGASPAEAATETTTPAKPDTAAKGAFLYAARSAEQAGDWRLALVNYRRALEIDPDNYRIMSNEAAAFNNLGMFEEGAREARRALERKPGYVPAMINAAIAYSSKGNSQEALRLFSAACAADPGNRNLVINLGILQERMGKLDEARATYRGLSGAGDPLALMGLARISERKGDRAGAVGNYRQVLALQNVSPAIKKEARDNMMRLEY